MPFTSHNRDLYSILKSSCDLQKMVREVVYYVAIEGQQAGPFKLSELKTLVKNGTLTSKTLIWTQGLAQWVISTTIPEVNKLLLLSLKPANAEHPLRKGLISALTGLGYKQSACAKIIDRILQNAPEISESNAIKEALKQLSSH